MCSTLQHLKVSVTAADIQMQLSRIWRLTLDKIWFKSAVFDKQGSKQPDWIRVSGPLAATIAVLLRAGWKPSTPSR